MRKEGKEMSKARSAVNAGKRTIDLWEQRKWSTKGVGKQRGVARRELTTKVHTWVRPEEACSGEQSGSERLAGYTGHRKHLHQSIGTDDLAHGPVNLVSLYPVSCVVVRLIPL